jgi:hypothetical protein
LQKYREALRSGAVLVDPADPGTEPRLLFCIEQSLHDAGLTAGGERRYVAEGNTISREVHFVEIDQAGEVQAGGSAPYLDYRAATGDEMSQIAPLLEADWLSVPEVEARVLEYAIDELARRHLERVRERREALIDKTLAAVQERLTKEINYWDARAATLRSQEKAGKPNARLNSQIAQGRADELAARLARRKEELAQERQIAASPPVVIGGALVIPVGLLFGDQTPAEIIDSRITEAIAMQAVMAAEVALGNDPRDVSRGKLGYDVESFDPQAGRLRFIEVKGHRKGSEEVFVTRNEILTALNVPEQFILALVEVDEGQGGEPRYVRDCSFTDPGDLGTGTRYSVAKLLRQSARPG